MNNLAYQPQDDEDAECDAIERYRRPGETFEQCEARLMREARDERDAADEARGLDDKDEF